MPQQINNGFETYQFTNQEELEGHVLHELLKNLIQNLKMETVIQKLYLTPSSRDEAGEREYWTQEAYLRGQIDAYNHLLLASDEAEKALLLRDQLADIQIESPANSSPV